MAGRNLVETVIHDHFTSLLWTRDRVDGNYVCRLKLRGYLKPYEFRTGPQYGFYGDEDIRYGNAYTEKHHWMMWKLLTKRFLEDYWSGRYWLITPEDYEGLDIGKLFRPNVRCDLTVELPETPAGANFTIQVNSLPEYRVNRANTGNNLGGDWVYDADRGSEPASPFNLAIIPKYGHLLSLALAGRQFASLNRYYQVAITDPGSGTVRKDKSSADEETGTGRRQAWHIRPWQDAMELHTGVAAHQWKVVTHRPDPKKL